MTTNHTHIRSIVQKILKENFFSDEEDDDNDFTSKWNDFDADETMGDAKKAAQKDIEKSGQKFEEPGTSKFEKDLDINEMLADLEKAKQGKSGANLKAIQKQIDHLKRFGGGSLSESSHEQDNYVGKLYTYHINLDERGEFFADVRNDETGKTIFEIKGYEIFQDGFMKNKGDIAGLKGYLVSLNLLKWNDILDIDEGSKHDALREEVRNTLNEKYSDVDIYDALGEEKINLTHKEYVQLKNDAVIKDWEMDDKITLDKPENKTKYDEYHLWFSHNDRSEVLSYVKGILHPGDSSNYIGDEEFDDFVDDLDEDFVHNEDKGDYYINLDSGGKKYYDVKSIRDIPGIYFAIGTREDSGTKPGEAFVHYDNALSPLYKTNNPEEEIIIPQLAGKDYYDLRSNINESENNSISRPLDSSGNEIKLKSRVEDNQTGSIGRVVRFGVDDNNKLNVHVSWISDFLKEVPKSIKYPKDITVKDSSQKKGLGEVSIEMLPE